MTKSYEQYCAAAKALDVIGDRWALLIVRELLTGPKRFRDLEEGLSGIAPNLLSERLRSLAVHGVLRRTTLPPPVGAAVYELTERGRELKPVLRALMRWGAPLLGTPRRGETFRPAWFMLILEAAFDPAAAGDDDIDAEFRIDGDVLHALIRGGRAETLQGPATDPDLVVEAAGRPFLAWSTGAISDAEALAAGVKVTGGSRGLRRLRRLFPAPV